MPRKLEILLKGGHVLDPANDIDGIRDVGILDGRIARVEENIPTNDAQRVIDVDKLVVTPGLLDIHVHTYYTRNRQPGTLVGSLVADAHFLKEGVTTCVDTGTAGADNQHIMFEGFVIHYLVGATPQTPRGRQRGPTRRARETRMCAPLQQPEVAPDAHGAQPNIHIRETDPDEAHPGVEHVPSI